MDSHLFAALEDAIEAWMDESCETDGWPNAWIYEDQARDMAKAAALVFDVNVKGQEYFKRENDLD